MGKSINICIACPDEANGTDWHRLLTPMWEMCADANLVVNRCADVLALTQAELDAQDVFIVSKFLTRNPEHTAKARAMFTASPCKLVVDVDDFWQMPTEHLGYNLWQHQRGEKSMKAAMKAADAIWTTTHHLAERIAELGHGDKTTIIRNAISRHDLQWSGAKLKVHSSVLRLGIVAGNSHWMNIAELHAGLSRMNHLHGWTIVAMGALPKDYALLKKMLGTDRVQFRPFLPPNEYAKQYQHIDVMLCPLARVDFNRYRSPIKVIECDVTGTGILAENFGPYEGAGQINEGGWAALPQIVEALLRQGVKHTPTSDMRHRQDAEDAKRITTIKNLCHGPL